MTTEEGQAAEAANCPYCGQPAADVHEEVDHMMAAHADIVAERLRAAGIPPTSVDDPRHELAAAKRIIARRDRKLAESLMLAEHWIRSSDNRTRILGADLKQVLDG